MWLLIYRGNKAEKKLEKKILHIDNRLNFPRRFKKNSYVPNNILQNIQSENDKTIVVKDFIHLTVIGKINTKR